MGTRGAVQDPAGGSLEVRHAEKETRRAERRQQLAEAADKRSRGDRL
jgi:hypothetical protein